MGGSVSCILASLNTVCSRQNLPGLILYFYCQPRTLAAPTLSSGGARALKPGNELLKQTNRLGYCLESCLVDSLDFPKWLSGSTTNAHLLSICLPSFDSSALEYFVFRLWSTTAKLVSCSDLEVNRWQTITATRKKNQRCRDAKIKKLHILDDIVSIHINKEMVHIFHINSIKKTENQIKKINNKIDKSHKNKRFQLKGLFHQFYTITWVWEVPPVRKK